MNLISERNFQKELFVKFIKNGSHRVGIPNSSVFGWDADFITVTRSNFSNEFEIKISRQDLMKELNALNPTQKSHPCYSKKLKHDCICGEEDRKINGPNYFWFVTLSGICKTDELPEYAGHIEARESAGRIIFRTLRKAKKLHKEMISCDQALRLATHGAWRLYSREII